MTAAPQPRTSGPARRGQSRFAPPSRTCRRDPHRWTARPANRLAGQKTAPGIFLAPARKTRQETVSLTLGTHQESSTYVFVFAPGCAVAPNSTGYGAPGADCSIKAVQAAQRAAGLPVDSPATIIARFGLPASNFAEGGEGLTGNVTQRLNAALNPSGLAVDRVQVGSVGEFSDLVASGGILILGTEVVNPEPGAGPLVLNHLVTAVPGGTDSSNLTIYNPSGSGGKVTYTPTNAWNHGFPTNGSAGSGKIWYVYSTDD